MSKKYTVFSFDGGGIRGIIPAIWIDHLEKKVMTRKKLIDQINMIAGTSTGSLIACGIAAGMDTTKIISLYEKCGPKIFPSAPGRLWNRALRTISQGVSAPKYDSIGTEKELKAAFSINGDPIRFGDLKIPTVVVSYDTLNRNPIFVKSFKEEHKNFEVWEICKASSSAPTYFPAHEMRVGHSILPLIDGGVVANNPTACVIAEAKRKSGRVIDDLLVASFGAGESNRQITRKEAKAWGALEWAIPIIDVLFDGSLDAVDYIVPERNINHRIYTIGYAVR